MHVYAIPKPVLWCVIRRHIQTQLIVLCQRTYALCYATTMREIWHRKHENHVKTTKNAVYRKNRKIEKGRKNARNDAKSHTPTLNDVVVLFLVAPRMLEPFRAVVLSFYFFRFFR